jgi:hypothetical protein
VPGHVLLVLILNLIAKEISEAEQVTRTVELATPRARGPRRLRWLQHGAYRTRELLHRERPGRRVQLVQHSQAPGARLLTQIQNGCRGPKPGVQDHLRLGMRRRSRIG